MKLSGTIPFSFSTPFGPETEVKGDMPPRPDWFRVPAPGGARAAAFEVALSRRPTESLLEQSSVISSLSVQVNNRWKILKLNSDTAAGPLPFEH